MQREVLKAKSAIKFSRIFLRAGVAGIILQLSFFYAVHGQITPPGIGKTNLASWFAVGLRQELDTNRNAYSITYMGIARSSHPENFNLLDRPSMWIVNQEFYHQFHKNWQYSFALSYRLQNEYEDTAPYEASDVYARQEVRVYGRYNYTLRKGRFQFTGTFRQEFRVFLTPRFQLWNEDMQIRSRLRARFAVLLGARQKNGISMGIEPLFSISHKRDVQPAWGSFDYRETRISVFYTHSPKNLPFTFSVGYMNNIIGKGPVSLGHFLAFDLILLNPFGSNLP